MNFSEQSLNADEINVEKIIDEIAEVLADIRTRNSLQLPFTEAEKAKIQQYCEQCEVILVTRSVSARTEERIYDLWQRMMQLLHMPLYFSENSE